MNPKPSSIKLATILMIGLSGLLFTACESETEWRNVYNGESLEGFDTYLGKSLGDKWADISGNATPESVFSVVEMDDRKVIRISGETNGSLATQETFENYHLRLVFKWGEKVYSKRNSGLLYHSFGEFGAAHGTWMPNIELQMMHGNLGDTYLMANTTCKIPAVKDPESKQWVYTPGVESVPFGEHAKGRLIQKIKDMEKPLGEWNTIDLYCFGQTAVHVINGETVMVNENTGTFENDKISPLTSGKIQLQSEGAELFIKSMAIRPIESIPAKLLN